MWIPTLTDTDQPRYLALVDAITRAIACGELQPGARLPPQRRLAWALGWNPSTTMQAYREAFGEGHARMVMTPDSEFFRYFRGSGGRLDAPAAPAPHPATAS